ncbi:MAG: hypothetical protein AAFY16_04035, partial [Cyanobacteria bacterium J06642_3]
MLNRKKLKTIANNLILGFILVLFLVNANSLHKSIFEKNSFKTDLNKLSLLRKINQHQSKILNQNYDGMHITKKSSDILYRFVIGDFNLSENKSSDVFSFSYIYDQDLINEFKNKYL